jgi:predicted RND superfamily exporter protein
MIEKVTKRIDDFAVRLAEFIMRSPCKVIVTMFLATIVAASGMQNLGFSNNYRVFFGPGNPELQAFETFQNTYTKNDNILFVLRPENGDAFDRQTIAAIERLTNDAWQIPYALRVDSITNFQYSWADGDDLTVEDLVSDGGNLSQTELERRKAIALAEPLLAGNLIAHDGVTSGINVTVQYPGLDATEIPAAIKYARELATGIEADFPGTEVAITGISALNNAFSEVGLRDAATLIPGMYLALLIVMFLVIRSVAATVATVLVVVMATLAALGTAGHMGWSLDPVSSSAPIIIMTLAVADSIHIVMTIRKLMRDGLDKIAAVIESVRMNFLAVSITSFTTVVGFSLLNFSDSPPFKLLGSMAAFGITAAWILSLTLIPAIIRLAPMHVTQRTGGGNALRALTGFAGFVTGHHRKILIVMAAATVTLIAFVPRIELNDEFVEYFDERVEFRRDTDFTQQHLRGIYLTEFSLRAADPGGISDPEYLNHVEAFANWLRQQSEVEHVFSYTDIIKRLNKNMHADDPDWYRIPDSRELAAQYLLLYELSLPYGLDLNDRVNIDKSAARLTVTLTDISSVEARAFYRKTAAWMQANTPETMWTAPTGGSVLFSYISQRNVESMLRGNIIAVIVIALIMMLALRSFGFGLLSLIPNAIPILVTFGIWALTVGQVGMPAATVSATSLGIIVDDTVHFLIKYLRAIRDKGMVRPDAIRYAFETVGLPIIATTVILASGFALLAASSFKLNNEMGTLTAIAIIVALIVDFLLLPAILMIGYRQPESMETENAGIVSQTV